MSSDNTGIDINHVAKLARIALSDEEKERYASQLGDVLEHFHRLNEVDVAGVKPSAHPFDLYNVWAEDVPVAGLAPDEALANAPAKRENQIVVPKVVDDA